MIAILSTLNKFCGLRTSRMGDVFRHLDFPDRRRLSHVPSCRTSQIPGWFLKLVGLVVAALVCLAAIKIVAG